MGAKTTILIAKANEPYFKELLGEACPEFTENTKNTSTFQLSEPDFIELYDHVKLAGNNPYALMSW